MTSLKIEQGEWRKVQLAERGVQAANGKLTEVVSTFGRPSHGQSCKVAPKAGSTFQEKCRDVPVGLPEAGPSAAFVNTTEVCSVLTARERL